MPAALPVDYRSLQVLFAQGHTLAELAENSGVSVNTLKARSAREGWKTKHEAVKLGRQAQQIAVAVGRNQMQPYATHGPDLLAATFSERKKSTKLHQSGYLERASKRLNDTPDDKLLSVTDAALQLATMASKVYPEDHSEAQVSLQFFNITQERAENGQNEGPEHRIYDIPGQGEAEIAGSPGDPMDDPAF